MTLTPDGGAALPVSVTTTRRVQGGAAIPVYGYMTAPTDGRPAMGGSAIPVRVLTAADLKQNGGQWTLEGRPHAMPVYTAPATTTVQGGPAIAVYPVNAWPTVPVVPPVPAFVPTDISGLALWLKADAGLFKDAAKAQPCTADADAVYTWADQSGNGNDATQSTDTRRPLLKLAIQNGKPVVRFDGSNDYMATGAWTEMAQPNTIYVVHKCTNPAGQYPVVYSGIVVTNVHQLWLGITEGQYNISTSATFAVTKASNAWYVQTSLYNGASSEAWFNGVSAGTGNVGTHTLTGMTVGITADLSSGTLKGDIAELLVYAGAHDATQKANVEAYLNTRWAVY